MTASEPNLVHYRAAVADLMIDLAGHTGAGDLLKATTILNNRATEPDLAGLFAATPAGTDAVLRTLLVEMETYHPNSRTSAHDMAALVRIFLLSQIDVYWWGRTTAFARDDDVRDSPALVDVAGLGVGFRYRRQATTFGGRAVRAVERRVAPQRTPRTAGLRFTRTRPEAVALLDALTADLRAAAPAGTPPLWVTSLTRSVSHQHHLRTLGYAAMLPSSHCTGYGIDIEMSWYRRFDADRVLRRLLLERQDAGHINVIDEGQAWHVCLSPESLPRLRADFDSRIGG